MGERNKRVFALLKEQNKTKAAMANHLGVSRSAISQWEKNGTDPTFEQCVSLADFFNVNLADIYFSDEANAVITRASSNVSDAIFKHISETGRQPTITEFDNIYPISVKKFPLLGEIACGEPIFANEDRESYILSGTNIDADFCLKAKGDSMMGARILDGDIVFIKETSIVDNGDIAAVAIDDEVLLKRFEYFKEENILALHSENPRYRTKRYMGEELNHIRVLGKAVAFQSDVI